MTGTPDVERREVRYTGRVQGVGFRYTTRSIAEQYRVAGHVRNLSDGSVELIVQGETDELDRFLSDVENRMGKNVTEITVNRTKPGTSMTGFQIRF